MANRDAGIISGKTLPTLEVVRMQKRLYLYVEAIKLFPHIIFQIYVSFL